MAGERETSRAAAIAVGCAVALAGAAIIVVAIAGSGEGFHAPRWVVGSAGASFLFMGGWMAILYARGYDPKRPEETLPPPAAQLAFAVPGMVFFAAPFHWVAFGPGPRAFSSTFSLPFVSVHSGTSGLGGRIVFGIGALMADAILIGALVRIARGARAK